MKINELIKVLSNNIIYINKKVKRHILINFIIKIISYILLYYIINISKEEISNKIIMIAEGVGDNTILNSRFGPIPDVILINNAPQEIYDDHYYVYELNEPINNITFIWNYQITDCSYMFNEIYCAISLDFSYFDTSSVVDMNHMFSGCLNLISLNLKNFDTSLVTDMSYMFHLCYSLNNLDVSNFKTSLVTNMNNIFSDCSLLK